MAGDAGAASRTYEVAWAQLRRTSPLPRKSREGCWLEGRRLVGTVGRVAAGIVRLGDMCCGSHRGSLPLIPAAAANHVGVSRGMSGKRVAVPLATMSRQSLLSSRSAERLGQLSSSCSVTLSGHGVQAKPVLLRREAKKEEYTSVVE